MNTATIDIGNSRIKLKYWDNRGIKSWTFPMQLTADYVCEEIKIQDVKGVIVSSVRCDVARFVDELRKKSGITVVYFNRDEISRHGDRIKYKGNVGPDRIAAYLGAKSQVKGKGMLIVDAGTAITIDLCDKEGNYRGGNISLGLMERKKALASSTGMLPLVEEWEGSYGEDHFFGTDTVSAIENGAKYGVLGEVKYAIKIARDQFDIDCMVIGGGDYKLIHQGVLRDCGLCIPDPDLVGRGLNFHLRKFYFPEEYIHTKFTQSI